MLFKILTILPLISICVNGTSDHEPKHAVSTQSFHRDDVPLSYRYTSVHIYTTPHPEQKPSNLHHTDYQGNPKFYPIQYAPLDQNTYQNDIHRHKHLQIPEEFQQTTDENRKQHLEPRAVVENFDVHDQNYRSFVPGHNIEVLQSNRALGQNDLYMAYHDNLQSQKVIIPKYAIQRKPEQVQRTEHLRVKEQRPLSEDHNVLYTLLSRPVVSTQYNAYAAEKPLQALSAKIPRLHLNLARVYGTAHIPNQAPATPTFIKTPNIRKPPSYTQAIFLPPKSSNQHKTILYPVQDTNKNYPVQT